jgi:hypothetical protein
MPPAFALSQDQTLRFIPTQPNPQGRHPYRLPPIQATTPRSDQTETNTRTHLSRNICQRIVKTRQQTPQKDRPRPNPAQTQTSSPRAKPAQSSKSAANVSLPSPDTIVNEQPRCRGQLPPRAPPRRRGRVLLAPPAGVNRVTRRRPRSTVRRKLQETRGVHRHQTPREAPYWATTRFAVKVFYDWVLTQFQIGACPAGLGCRGL